MKALCLPSVSPSLKLSPDLQLSQRGIVLSSLGREQGWDTSCPQPGVAAPMPPGSSPFCWGAGRLSPEFRRPPPAALSSRATASSVAYAFLPIFLKILGMTSGDHRDSDWIFRLGRAQRGQGTCPL